MERNSARWVSPRASAIPHRRFSRLVGVETPEDESVFPVSRPGKRWLPSHRWLLGWLLLAGLCAGGSLWSFGQRRGTLDRGPGQVVADFEIRDVRTGQLDRLSEHRGRVVAIVFTGTSCPVGDLYMPRLSDLARFFEMRDVDFLAINSNASDSIEDVAEHARRSRITFPVLKDPENHVADRLLAERTCEALVIDGRGTLRYRGAIDDQYGLGTRRDSPGHTYLVDAIEAVLAGREVSPATTQVAGCPIERVIK
ncbi:MAG: redoxin domain-containing protein [Isosphaerales bacterium]